MTVGVVVRLARQCFWVIAFLAFPIVGYAQDAAITGTISDATGGVLPGVTVTAVNEAVGNTYEAVTDARGVFRMPARIGTYRITATLPGFADANRTGLLALLCHLLSGGFRWKETIRFINLRLLTT